MRATLDAVTLRFFLPTDGPHADIPRVGDEVSIQIQRGIFCWAFVGKVKRLEEHVEPESIATVEVDRVDIPS